MTSPIAFIAKSVSPIGGMEADMLKCIRALCKQGREVHVFYGFKDPRTDAAVSDCTVCWHHVGMPKRPPLLGQIVLWLRLHPMLEQLRKQHSDLDIISLERLPLGDVHIGAAPQDLWTAARRRMGLSPFSQLPYRFWLQKMDQYLQHKSGSTLLIFAERDRKALLERGVDAERIARVIIPTDTARFVPSEAESRRYVTLIGANPKLKGIDLALQVWPEIARRHPDLFLRIVAKGWKARKAVERAGVERVELADVISDVEHYYHSSRLLLAPSMFETWGNIVPEALACGVPVVASSDVPSSEILQGQETFGVVFERDGVHDADRLQQAIEQALTLAMDPDTMQQRHRAVADYMAAHDNLSDWLCKRP